jgi:hypothetical protein
LAAVPDTSIKQYAVFFFSMISSVLPPSIGALDCWVAPPDFCVHIRVPLGVVLLVAPDLEIVTVAVSVLFLLLL